MGAPGLRHVVYKDGVMRMPAERRREQSPESPERSYKRLKKPLRASGLLFLDSSTLIMENLLCALLALQPDYRNVTEQHIGENMDLGFIYTVSVLREPLPSLLVTVSLHCSLSEDGDMIALDGDNDLATKGKVGSPEKREVLLLTSAEDLDCTPGFQQKVFHIDQPAEFIEDQSILNSIIPNGVYINMRGNVKPP
ncbi:Cadherin-13 [Galemys pyrenaicus]|uniref:Cadherin-13 n=1 Tax=Galemys pyrenaicus TaxID=202257 RepID=A0A8J6A7L6_GALPY|nr:Cadherin-13 [Galemys pyrenaicus]